MEICPYRTLCCVVLVFLGYQEICAIKYLQNETMREVDLTTKRQITSPCVFIVVKTTPELGVKQNPASAKRLTSTWSRATISR